MEKANPPELLAGIILSCGTRRIHWKNTGLTEPEGPTRPGLEVELRGLPCSLGTGWLHPRLAWAACFCCEEFHLQIPALPLGHLFKDKSHEGWSNITHLLYQGAEWESPSLWSEISCGQR